MCQIKQCCAPIVVNKRCPNETYKSFNHCLDHCEKANKLYKYYKQVCEVAYKLDINKKIEDLKQKITYLNDCYLWFVRAYDARMKHRNYAYVPECYDSGHNLQFKIIQDKIDICNSKLYVAYKSYAVKTKTPIQAEINITENNINNCDKDDEIEKIMQGMHDFKKRQKEDTRETQRVLQEYMKENKIETEKKSKLVSLYVKAIKPIVDLIEMKTLDEKGQYIIQTTIFHIALRLNNLDYFDGNYEPEKCDCDCGSYLSHGISLGCRCNLGYDNISSYMNSHTIYHLKMVYMLVLNNQSIIKEFIKDVIYHYKLYDDTIFTTDFELLWNDTENRLKIKEADCKIEKKSKYMARFRLKDKLLRKKCEEDIYLSSDDEN
jgi:hypothetical protein